MNTITSTTSTAQDAQDAHAIQRLPAIWRPEAPTTWEGVWKAHNPAEGRSTHRAMGATLERYRASYTPATSASGRPSLHNGDDLATLLSGISPNDVARTAMAVLGEGVGDLVERYSRLNPGQIRMNSGNRIRAAIKKGLITVDEVATVIAAA